MKRTILIVVGLGLLLLYCDNDEKRVEQRVLDLLHHKEAIGVSEHLSIYRFPSLNFNLRTPNYIILHHTALYQCEEALNHLTNLRSRVSAHYLICKDGTIYQLVDDYGRAWHTGVSSWGNITDMNSVSLGIEMDNSGFEPFPEIQIESLINLLKFIIDKYHIPLANILAHGEIAPGRKEDPNCLFPWQTLADVGVALMPDNAYTDFVPVNFEPITVLNLIGYDIRNPDAAIDAFRRRYVGCTKHKGYPLNASEINILYNLFEMNVLTQVNYPAIR